MRIGISTSVMQRGKTGIAQYLLSLLDHFTTRNSGHEFVLFALEEDLPLLEPFRAGAQLVTVPERFRPPITNILWHQTVLPRLASQLELDVLHVPSYRRLIGRHPCALVGTIHDLAPFRLNGKYDWKRMFYGRVVVKHLVRRQHALIAVSHYTAEDIQRFFKPPHDRLFVVPNGIDHARFFPGDPPAARMRVAQRHGLERPFFLYVSRLEHPGKNHVRLIDAFNRFKWRTRSDWQLVFGGSDWHGADAIHEARHISPFASDIRCLGFVENADLPDLYRAAEGFVYPSLFEGFGLPPVEAMACGCPVISSTRGALGEVIGEAALKVNPEEVEDISEALRNVSGSGELRQALREKGLARAAEYRWDRAATATLEVYEWAAARVKTRGQNASALPRQVHTAEGRP
jgi:glycosyltransferase involved in cell wall biosynthesis